MSALQKILVLSCLGTIEIQTKHGLLIMLWFRDNKPTLSVECTTPELLDYKQNPEQMELLMHKLIDKLVEETGVNLWN